jgi:glycosyltransferase involved in cell wall biosynthesis
MKILIINDYIENIGGAENYIHEIKKLLEKNNHNVEILAGSINKNKIFKFINSIYNLKFKREFREKIECFIPDIIWVHNIGWNLSPSFMNVSYKKKIPILQTFHDTLQYRYRIKLNNILLIPKIFIHRYLIKKYVSYFIAPSNYVMNWAKNDLKIKNIELIRNPVFMDIRKFVNKKIENKICYVGNLIEIKGIKILLKAFSEILVNTNNNIKLLLIGDGPEKKNLEKIAYKLGISDNIKFKGRINNNDLCDEYFHSDICVLPSLINENSPLVLLESLSQGTPVITTNIGGQKEIVIQGYNGFLVNPKDSEDLAEKLLLILKNKNLKGKMSNNCLEFAKNFSKDEQLDKITKLLQKLVE